MTKQLATLDIMDRDAFMKSLEAEKPPQGLSAALEGLWYARKGEWDIAHERAQSQEDRDGAWVHAHLHRQEGDASNAAYWYRRAGKPAANQPIEEEWVAIVQTLLKDSPSNET